MLKYDLIPQQLLLEGVVSPENFFQPGLVEKPTLLLVHELHYVDSLFDLTLDPKMVRRIGFPLSTSLVERERLIVDGTIQTSLHALKSGISFNTAGGTHHAGRDFGEGFCLFNDQAVGAAYMLRHGWAKRILIIDLDVHQGNGTAHIFHDHPNVFTFSMHGEKNFPFIKEQSFLDVGLADGIGDDVYMQMLEVNLEQLFTTIRPDFVFYQAGVDVLMTDKLGKLTMTIQGCRRRDELVFQYCKRFGTAVQVSMGGGYSVQLKDIVRAHVNTFKVGMKIFGL